MLNWIRQTLGREPRQAGPASPTAATAASSDESRAHGNRLLDEGKLDEAAQCYREAIRLDPASAAAHVNLGYVLIELKRPAEAEPVLRQAAMLDPEGFDAHYMLAGIDSAQGRLDQAIANYHRVLERKPDFEPAYRGLCMALFRNGNVAEARAAVERGLAACGPVADFHYYLGNILAHERAPEVAMECFRQALALQPRHLDALCNLGDLLVLQNRHREALDVYRQASLIDPARAGLYVAMGNALQATGNPASAIKSYVKALSLQPDNAEAYCNLSVAQFSLNQTEEAMDSARRAIALKPGYAEAHNNLGNALEELSRFDEAEVQYRKAIEANPDYAQAHSNLAVALKDQGKLGEAIRCYRRAIVLKPDQFEPSSNLVFAMVYAAEASPADVAEAARDFARRLTDPLRRERPFAQDADPARKLRVGYVSGDFKDHPVNYFFEPLLRLHDRNQFEIFGYSNVLVEDGVTERLKGEFDHWRDIRGLSDDEAADLIESDRIDLLMDLAGHTGGNRLLVFARKPAPVQVTWLGHPATTGMAAMDYRVTDALAEPEGMTEHLNVETLWRLSGPMFCYQARENSPAVIDHPPSDDNGYVTFGCFNNFAKVADPVLATWAQILARIPNARLLLEITGIDNPVFLRETRERIQRLGLPLERVILEPRRKANQFALYNKIDIALDPFPFTGGTTSMDTLWMGVPFISLAGEHFVSRMGVSILTHAGMPELIAADRAQYVDIAVRLATDSAGLRAMRSGLRERVAASLLMNQKQFARSMETAYRGMWQSWCQRQPASSPSA